MKPAIFPLAIAAWLFFVALGIAAYAGSQRAMAIAEDKCLVLPSYNTAEWAFIWPIELAIAARSGVKC